MQEVWFKRDLRINDHAPLAAVAKRGPVLCLCVSCSKPRISIRRTWFLLTRVYEVQTMLYEIAAPSLTYRAGEMPTVLEQLHREHTINNLWRHQEIGNGVIYACGESRPRPAEKRPGPGDAAKIYNQQGSRGQPNGPSSGKKRSA